MQPVIHRVTELDLRLKQQPWPFAEQRRDEIAAHFAMRQREKPKLFNGRILLGRDPVFSGTRLSADYFETDFANLLAWRDWGYPDKTVFNGFGMGALLCADGAFVLGQMADHTANAGQIYFAAGTPDRDDIRGTHVDIAASVAREVGEETGLTEDDYQAVAHWDCVTSTSWMAMMRVLRVASTGDALRAKIEANLADQDTPELCGIHLVRHARDITPTMPVFVTAFLEAQLAFR
jgi:8-oxo-dGTP pyrophosphatase MutT (NUDIX family)